MITFALIDQLTLILEDYPMSARTTVRVPGQDDFTFPGALTVAQAKSFIQATVPSINSMDGTIESGTPGGTGNVVIAFTQRSGSKG